MPLLSRDTIAEAAEKTFKKTLSQPATEAFFKQYTPQLRISKVGGQPFQMVNRYVINSASVTIGTLKDFTPAAVMAAYDRLALNEEDIKIVFTSQKQLLENLSAEVVAILNKGTDNDTDGILEMKDAALSAASLIYKQKNILTDFPELGNK